MSKLSELGKSVGIKETHIKSLKDLAEVITQLPEPARNLAADYALSASGIDIADFLGRLTPAQKNKVKAVVKQWEKDGK